MKGRIKMIENDDKGLNWYVLHQLLELAMNATGRGCVSDDYTKFIEFDIGGVTIFSDSYYGNIQIDEQDLDDKEIQNLIKEIKSRLLEFDKKIKTTREKLAADIFDKPIKLQED